ncbi:MAG TPA: type II secretion system protein GspG [Gammaproteobacteria bacterium]|nr:type II secretion system protein GspG [Gammaproteobacteria bacterium]
MMHETKHRAGGFTLIEVMVVVVILGILAAVLVPKVMDRPDEARKVKAAQDIRALEATLNLYKLDNYEYPNTEQGLEALVKKTNIPPEPPRFKAGGYLDRLPLDPWRQPYQFLSPGVHGSIDIFSTGPDRQPSDDDIGNWIVQ